MELQTNEIYSKGFFFSGDLNINAGQKHSIDPSVIPNIPTVTLGDLVEGAMQGTLIIEPTLFSNLLAAYIGKKFPELLDAPIDINRGLFEKSQEEVITTK